MKRKPAIHLDPGDVIVVYQTLSGCLEVKRFKTTQEAMKVCESYSPFQFQIIRAKKGKGNGTSVNLHRNQTEGWINVIKKLKK